MLAVVAGLFLAANARNAVAYFTSDESYAPPNSETALVAGASEIEAAASMTTTYTITFDATWSDQTHPHPSFPSDAHFSPLIGAVHADTVTFWAADGVSVATPGIEHMAETGGTSILADEIQAQIPDHARSTITGTGTFSPGEVNIHSIEVSREFPLVTLVTMVAPSPDWFVGVSGLSLLDDGGQWVISKTVQLYPYDAGTDSGPDYTSPNADVTPHEPIANITGEFPFSDQPLGTFTFTRLETEERRVYLPLILTNN
jgi:hypothetical protein